ncbi:MAG: NADH:flavin oxidoreductase [Candidatus Scalindua rubra]|uniref:NADH:flavin oxidoreductase n=1 Tax=Candidatus Scalindua rubra TaxID=1872076 RepID=A0A1E3X8Z9_9BACT|nr:MAG: NADH:flavin oxidoreductase [Candidatus Scalindua rubra]
MKFERLFEPIDIRGFLLRNRITMSAMPTGFSCTKGYVTRKMVSYYARRAKGGASLIVVEGSGVEEKGKIYSSQLMASDDTYLSGLNELAEGIKKNGAFAVLQLQHGGRFAMGSNPMSASVVSFTCPCTGREIVPVSMTEDDINATITSFTNAAVLAKQAGFDMIEINGGYGHLLSQFLSPKTNKRNDKYGGSLEGRMKLPLDIIESIREELGDSLPIGYQLMADELLADGFSLNEARTFTRKLEESGVAYLTVTCGTPESFFNGDGLFAMRSPEGGTSQISKDIKGEVSIPVFATGKVTNVQMVEDILASGNADALALDRALFCDPDLPVKARSEKINDIIECVSCANCNDRVMKGLGADCTVNPRVGRKSEEINAGLFVKKKVLIAGSGPGGIVAALTASERGHDVTLLEKGPKLGGHLKAAPKAPGKTPWIKLLDYLSNQLKETRVDVKMECAIDEEYLKNNLPDVLVIGTGVKLKKITVPVSEGREVDGPGAVLFGKKEPRENNVIIGAGFIGSEIAECIGEKGKKATIIEKLASVAQDMDLVNRTILLRKLDEYGVQFYLNSRLLEITKDEVIIEDDTGKRVEIKADLVINASGFNPANDFYPKAKDLVNEVHLIGDAKLPRNIHDAVHEGYQIGLNI